MNRRTAILAGALALVVLACAGFLLWQRASAQAGVSVRIYQYGELVEEVRLDQVTEPYTIPLSGEDGAENLVEVAPGRVRMQSANCGPRPGPDAERQLPRPGVRESGVDLRRLGAGGLPAPPGRP